MATDVFLNGKHIHIWLLINYAGSIYSY